MEGLKQLEIHQLEVHSKSYVVQWVKVPEAHTLWWTLNPHKKSLRFSVIKHPGQPNGSSSRSIFPSTEHSPAHSPAPRDKDDAHSTHPPSSALTEKLAQLGMRSVISVDRYDADKFATGEVDIPRGEAGMYGLVLDNTQSKQVSKTVTLAHSFYPTGTGSKSGLHLHLAQNASKNTSLVDSLRPSPRLAQVGPNGSKDSLVSDPADVPRAHSRTTTGSEYKTSNGDSFFTGMLSKKRRKQNQGYARRFFSLDFTSATLSYYKNRNSSALRGSVPLSLAAIATEDKSRTISVDSGAELWLLKAGSAKDFAAWKDALERARTKVHTAVTGTPDALTPLRSMTLSPGRFDPDTEREWNEAENIIGRVAGIRDAVRRLAQDTDPKYLPQAQQSLSSSPTPDGQSPTDYFGKPERSPSFWKRKPSAGSPAADSKPRNKSLSGKLAPPSTTPDAPISVPKRRLPADESIHGNCVALLRDLDAVVGDFSALLNESKQRRIPEKTLALKSRASMESSFSQEFFDAEGDDDGGLLTIRRNSHESRDPSMHEVGDADAGESGSVSSISESGTVHHRDPGAQLFPIKPKSLKPLPMQVSVDRRAIIPPATGPPPSLISFLRKNVGKDLTQIAMPVSANEPLSLLQKQAEMMEYSHLLDAVAESLANHQLPNGNAASSLDDAAAHRLLYVAAFAISSLSSSRDKARATRKPFNPLLGETYELVRPDLGWRLLSEKVSHRPVRVATAAESERGWALSYTVAPDQKFWGKSAEIISDGRVRLSFFGSSAGEVERYSFSQATCFLRNIIAGEKYVEPVGELTVTEETTGHKAVVTFKAGGVFSGRSEEITAKSIDADGESLGWGLTGKWTSHLQLTNDSGNAVDEVWKVGELVASPQTHFGFTAFAAALNETTELEQSKLPRTDSRLRPDQAAYEQGDVGAAERLKAKLEEAQRARRKEQKDARIRWFEPVHGDQHEWKRVEGDKSYWSTREKGQWPAEDIFNV